jgi:hypothetical protein
MKQFDVPSTAFHRIPFQNDENSNFGVVIVCGHQINIPLILLESISQKLFTHFQHSSDPFIINAPVGLHSKSISRESIYSSAQLFELLLTGFGSISLESKDFESLKYIFENLESSSLLRELGSQMNSLSEFTIRPFHILNDSDNENEIEKFTFYIGAEHFETSILRASLLSENAFSKIEESVYSMVINIPKEFDYFEYFSAFQNIFNLQFGFPLSIDLSNIQIYSSISSQIQLSELFNYLKSIENIEFSENDFILFLSKYPTFSSNLLSKSIEFISKSFSKVETKNLLKIHPQNLSKVLQSESLLIESNDSLFDFLIKYFSEWGNSSSFLFQFIDFRLLSISKLNFFFKTTLKTAFSIGILDSLSKLFEFDFNSNSNSSSAPNLKRSKEQLKDNPNSFFNNFVEFSKHPKVVFIQNEFQNQNQNQKENPNPNSGKNDYLSLFSQIENAKSVIDEIGNSIETDKIIL